MTLRQKPTKSYKYTSSERKIAREVWSLSSELRKINKEHTEISNQLIRRPSCKLGKRVRKMGDLYVKKIEERKRLIKKLGGKYTPRK